jgi:hypothetical protein
MKNNIILFIVAFLAINNIFAAETNDTTNNIQNIRTVWHAISAGNAILPNIDNFTATIEDSYFASDGSEDSVFFLAIYYIMKVGINNTSIDQLEALFNAIRWSEITPSYFYSDVLHVVKRLNNEVLTEMYTQEREHKKRSPIPNPSTRTLLPDLTADPNVIVAKATFPRVNTYEIGSKKYSSAVLIKGRLYYYILNPSPNGLNGFLSLCSPILDRPYTINLPLTYRVTILHKAKNDQTERIFSSMNVIYDFLEQEIGGRLTIGHETWEDVKNGCLEGEDKLANTITIRLTIDFNMQRNQPYYKQPDQISQINSGGKKKGHPLIN